MVHLFHTTGTRDPRLRLVQPTRAKQDAHTGPRVTLDGLHLHVGGYCCQGSLSPPAQRAAYHPLAALLYVLREILPDVEHQEPNADVGWHEPLYPRPHAPTPIWLVATDDECAKGTEQAQFLAAWVIVQAGGGPAQAPWTPPRHCSAGGYRGAARPAGGGARARGPAGGHGTPGGAPARRPAWLREHVTALWSWARTIAGAEVRLHDHPAVRPGDTGALSVDQLTPSHPDVRWHFANLNAVWLSPTGYYWIPEAWGHTSSDASGGGPYRHATSVALAADLNRRWAVAI